MVAIAPTAICKRNMVKTLEVYAAKGDWEGLGFMMGIEEIDPKEHRANRREERKARKVCSLTDRDSNVEG